MARPRAADHEEKRQAILKQAAELFATHGYDRASLAMLAKACDVSKTLVYHYWTDKAALLFDVLAQHLQQLVEIARGAVGTTPRARLETLAFLLLDAYRDADAVHRVQITCLTLLAPAQQEALRSLERALVAEAAAIIADLHPTLAEDRRLLKPLTMSFFAMLNWHHLWHRDRGPLSREDYARMVAALIAEGGGPAARILGPALDSA
ncbi:TetR/AcrR family transcriptional regulator [Roseomonas stagni]|uniref:TetR/AcrR family transcriptional regulator n=1 Tax=Falsiroseomonas algicola TaxID=2716930 RepID=A0A6M1LKJ6_9PROT|nr:TetR/AcrR family transcriptional regulator [Falsiroseomonas algicola]NGM20858.1 TetR/AcrR family transcriptional regulator [Falsiroseomonas algicola]